MDAPDGWVPEFPGQRPPFQPGNRMSVGNRGPLKHGASSPRMYLPLAKKIASDLKRTPGLEYLGAPRFLDQLMRYATALARWQLATEWVDAMPIEQAATAPEGGAHAPMELMLELGARVDTLGGPLGFHPSTYHLYAREIEAAQQAALATMRKREEAKQLQADLREAMGKQARAGDDWLNEFNRKHGGEK